MSAENFAVALTKTQCPACGKLSDGPIVLNSRLSEKAAREVKELQGKVVELGLCSECKAVVDQGGMLLVEIDRKKSGVAKDGKLKPENAWRTGRVWGITGEAATRFFSERSPIGYIDTETAEVLGLTAITEDMRAEK